MRSSSPRPRRQQLPIAREEMPHVRTITIRDNDEEPVLGLSVSPGRIVESGSTSAAITVGSTNGTS